MCRMVTITLVLAAIAVGGEASVGSAELSVRTLPAPPSDVGLSESNAVLNNDGSIWVIYGLEAKPDYFSRRHMRTWKQVEAATDVGLFCKLVASDGTELLGPIQLMKIKIWEIPRGPSYFIPVALPGGDVLVFAQKVESPPPNLSKSERHNWQPKRPTTVVFRVNRRGTVRQVSLDGWYFGPWGMYFLPPGLGFWTWFDDAGDLRVITSDEYGRALYSRIRIQNGSLSLRSPPAEYAVTSRALEDRQKSSGVSDWTLRAWHFADVAPLTSETLLVAYMPSYYDSLNGTQPCDSLVVYRLATADLGLAESFSVKGSAVAGCDYADMWFSRAVLQKTTDGFAFFISFPEGTRMYRLDPRGSPIMGKRTVVEADVQVDYDGTGRQFLGTHSRPDWRGKQTEWFGISESGQLFHDAFLQMPSR